MLLEILKSLLNYFLFVKTDDLLNEAISLIGLLCFANRKSLTRRNKLRTVQVFKLFTVFK